DLARDDDEAFALVQAVLEIRESALVAPAAEKEGRIGIELKGFGREAVIRFVHRLPIGRCTRRPAGQRLRCSWEQRWSSTPGSARPRTPWCAGRSASTA